MTHSGASPDDLDTDTRSLLDYCNEQHIHISTKIVPRRVQGRGLGIYSTTRISNGDQLMHVPASALLTTRSIPDSFISKTARKDVPVHAQLAAYLTFGLDGACNPFDRWMATWPKLTDFTNTMPMLWPVKLFHSRPPPSQTKSNRTMISLRHVHFPSPSVLPPPITGVWSLTGATYSTGPTPVAAAQRLKLQSHLQLVAEVLPEQAQDLLSPTSPIHWRFVHMWCCVNTRCFYYLHPRQSKPADPNEAMAMAPGMDLFNHTDKPGCFTKYDKSGYNLVADRDYEVDEEVLISYGAHTNDILWAEYGFMMDENVEDAVRIDDVVLQGLLKKEKGILEEYGYLGDYWLTKNAPCYRTEMAVYGRILSDRLWKKVLAGTWEPYTLDKEHRRRAMEMGDLLLVIEEICDNNLKALRDMSVDQIADALGDAPETLIARGYMPDNIDGPRKAQALRRHAMCLKRWEQIRKMATAGFEVWPSVYHLLDGATPNW